MINSIAKKKPVAPADARRAGLAGGHRDLLDAAGRASAKTISSFRTVSLELGQGGKTGAARQAGKTPA